MYHFSEYALPSYDLEWKDRYFFSIISGSYCVVFPPYPDSRNIILWVTFSLLRYDTAIYILVSQVDWLLQ